MCLCPGICDLNYSLCVRVNVNYSPCVRVNWWTISHVHVNTRWTWIEKSSPCVPALNSKVLTFTASSKAAFSSLALVRYCLVLVSLERCQSRRYSLCQIIQLLRLSCQFPYLSFCSAVKYLSCWHVSSNLALSSFSWYIVLLAFLLIVTPPGGGRSTNQFFQVERMQQVWNSVQTII